MRGAFSTLQRYVTECVLSDTGENGAGLSYQPKNQSAFERRMRQQVIIVRII
jgi:hypothetical protein